MYFRHGFCFLSLILIGATEERNTCDLKVFCDQYDTKNCYYKLNNYKSRDTLLEFSHSTKEYLSENYDYPPILPIYGDKVKTYSNKNEKYHRLLATGRDTQTLLVEPQNYDINLKFYVNEYPNGLHYKLTRTRDNLKLQLCHHNNICEYLIANEINTATVSYNKVFCNINCVEIKSLIISWNYNANNLNFTVQENNKIRHKFVLTDELANARATEGIFEYFDTSVGKTETIIKNIIFQKRIHSPENYLATSNYFNMEANESIFFDFYVPPKFPTKISLLCPDLNVNTDVHLTNTDEIHYWQQVMLPVKAQNKSYKNCVVQIENKGNVFWKMAHFSWDYSAFFAKVFNTNKKIKRSTGIGDETNCEAKCNKKDTHEVMYKDYCNLDARFGMGENSNIGLCSNDNLCASIPNKKMIVNITVCVVDSNGIDAVIVKWCAESVKANQNKEKIYGFKIKVNYKNKNVFEKNKSIPYAINAEIKCYTDILYKLVVQELEISSIFHETKMFHGKILNQNACMST